MKEHSGRKRSLSPTNSPNVSFSRIRIIKNLVVQSIGFLIFFVAFYSLVTLQSTLNHQNGIGVISLAIVFFFYGIASILLPKYVTKKFGSKLTMVISLVFYLPYVTSNLYPHLAFMIPTAIFKGISTSLAWGAQCVYLNRIAVLYALHSAGKPKEGRSKTALLKKNFIKELSTTENNAKENPSTSTNLFNSNSRIIFTVDKNTKEEFVNFIKSKNASPSLLQNEFLTETDNSTSSLNQILRLNDEAGEIEINTVPSETSNSKSNLSNTIEFTIAKFFGLHSMAYLSTHLWSNLMSYFILRGDISHTNTSINSSCVCGAYFCNAESECLINNLQLPSNETRFLLTYICIGLCFLSILFMSVFLDSLNDKDEVKFSFQILMATIKQFKNKIQILLIPLTFYIGMFEGFFIGEYTVSYVGCSWGTYHVGLVAACYGGACALSTGIAGWLVKRVGGIPIFVTSAIIGITSMILLLLWNPSADHPTMFFVTSGLCGISIGIIWSQMKAMYGILFKGNEEAAFASCNVWFALGYCLSVAYSNHFCTYIKIYILMVILIIGMFGYLRIELCSRR